MTPLPAPQEIMAWLDQAATELDDLGKRLEDAYLSQGDAEAAWEDAKDVALLEIVEEYENSGARLPGVDVRLALVRKRVGFQTYRDYIKAKALVKGLENRSKKTEQAVMARQSTLKAIGQGMSLEGYGKPPESRPKREPGNTYEGGPGEWRNA